MNKVFLIGNLTRDPELRTTPNGASVCSFSVAVNRVYKDANGAQREDVSFIDCSAWGKLGEMISQYAKKGAGVLVSGRLDQRSWEDKTTGQKYLDDDLYRALSYTQNDEKTDKKMYVSTINCPKHDPYGAMIATKKQFGKMAGQILLKIIF